MYSDQGKTWVAEKEYLEENIIYIQIYLDKATSIFILVSNVETWVEMLK